MDGRTMPLPQINLLDDGAVDTKNAKKVNLPDDENSINGEGIWVVGNEAFNRDYESDNKGNVHIVMTLNHSFAGVPWGAFIPVKMNGANRPVAIFNEIDQQEEFIVFQ
jgi:hypothetical protein